MQAAPQPRKGFQNLGFGGVLSSLSFAAERKGAAGGMDGRGGITDCHGQFTNRLHKECGTGPGGGVRAPRPTEDKKTYAAPVWVVREADPYTRLSLNAP